MQTPPQGQPHWLILWILMLVMTACATTVTRVPVEQLMDLNSQWSDTDSRVTAEAMIQEALDRPWAERFTQTAGRAPIVTVGTVLNRTHGYLNTQTFIKDLERALSQSGQVQFMADAGQRQERPQERPGQAQYARPDTVTPGRQEWEADFLLQGTINSLVDQRDNTRTVFYQVDLELIDIASNVKVWLGQKKVKKLAERSKATL